MHGFSVFGFLAESLGFLDVLQMSHFYFL